MLRHRFSLAYAEIVSTTLASIFGLVNLFARSLGGLTKLKVLILDGNRDLTISAETRAAIEAAMPDAEKLRFPPDAAAADPTVT